MTPLALCVALFYHYITEESCRRQHCLRHSSPDHYHAPLPCKDYPVSSWSSPEAFALVNFSQSSVLCSCYHSSISTATFLCRFSNTSHSSSPCPSLNHRTYSLWLALWQKHSQPFGSQGSACPCFVRSSIHPRPPYS